MAILAIDHHALVISLKSVSESDDLLLEEMKEFIPRSRFIILNIEYILFSTLLIGEIINAYNLFKEHWDGKAHQMAIIHPDESAQRVFKLSRLSDTIPVYNTVEDALKALPLTSTI